MTLGYPTRLTCPHCGKVKHILSIASGNTFGATYWSDTKHDYPMLECPSSVQRCPHCGHYYFYDDANPVDCDPDALSKKRSLTDWDVEWPGDAGNATISEVKDPKRKWDRWNEASANGFGELSFPEMDAAFGELFSSADVKRQRTLLFMWLYSFNDTFGGRQDGPAQECPQGVMERRRFVVDEICQRFEGKSLLVAELHREMGEFDECIRIACEDANEADNNWIRMIRSQIVAHAEARETAVFPLPFLP